MPTPVSPSDCQPVCHCHRCCICGKAGQRTGRSGFGRAVRLRDEPHGAAAGSQRKRAELEREIGKLEDRFLQLEKSNQELKASNEQLRQKLRVAAVAGKGFSRSLARRTSSRVSRHIAAAGGVAVPYVGAGVLSGMIRLDVRDGCETLEELNDLNRALDLDSVETSRVCVMQVPSGEQILAQVLANWRTAYAISAAWANQYQAVLPPEPPVVPYAGANELWMAVFGVPHPLPPCRFRPRGRPRRRHPCRRPLRCRRPCACPELRPGRAIRRRRRLRRRHRAGFALLPQGGARP